MELLENINKNEDDISAFLFERQLPTSHLVAAVEKSWLTSSKKENVLILIIVVIKNCFILSSLFSTS